MDAQKKHHGIFFALIAYFIWGLAPAYFKTIENVPLENILIYRIIWSFFFMIMLISVSKSWHQVKMIIQNYKKILILFVSALLIAGNWLLFIWAVNNHHMIEASLGYFINPLVNIFLGMLFLGERFRLSQWLAVMLVFFGILIQLWYVGSLPIIGLGLAFSFGFYGLIRKKLSINVQAGIFIEILWLLLIAIMYLLLIADNPISQLNNNSWSLNILLMFSGVITSVPLLFFTAATTYLRLSTLGIFQYLAPTLMFILAISFYDETVGKDKLLTFCFILAALLIFTCDALYAQKKKLCNKL
ncbi:Protein RarD [Candidatus Ecksteinia adelgidicola]|nr:Protein RarD [Candidatus Ecksteinia adelgidicola]